MKGDVRQLYFEWMCNLISDVYHCAKDYSLLLQCLHNIDFQYILDRDANRFEDGVSLRYRFAVDTGLSQAEVMPIDDRPCSVLEMIVALCFRCEETIMSNSKFGDRTGTWFWETMDSLGLSFMQNVYFHEGKVRTVIRKFLLREYAPNGQGGLVTSHDPTVDMRNIEIWVQMMMHFNELEE